MARSKGASRYTGWLPPDQIMRLMRARMTELGWIPADLIDDIRRRLPPGEAGGLQSMISRCYNGKGVSDAYLPQVEISLQISLRAEGESVSENGHNEVDNARMTRAISKVGVPLYASVAGSGGTMLLEVAASEHRKDGPPSLEGVRGAYGVRVSGSMMEPRYEPGEIIWLNPNIPGRVGDYVLLFPDDGSTRRCLRKLISETDSEWTVRQLNPDRTSKLKKSEWPTCLQVKDNR